MITQGRKAGRTLGDPQGDAVAIAHEDVSGIACAARDRKNLKRLPEEWMGRIGYFSAVTASTIRVVEGGIKKGFRLTRSTTSGWSSSWSIGSAIAVFFD